MGCHCLPIVGEEIFKGGPPARLLRQQRSHCRTQRGQLAPGGLCLLRLGLGSTKQGGGGGGNGGGFWWARRCKSPTSTSPPRAAT